MGRHCAMEAMPHVADAAWRGQLSGRQGHGVVKTWIVLQEVAEDSTIVFVHSNCHQPSFNPRENPSPRQIHASTLSSARSEEHTSELQSPCNLVCRLLLEKK